MHIPPGPYALQAGLLSSFSATNNFPQCNPSTCLVVVFWLHTQLVSGNGALKLRRLQIKTEEELEVLRYANSVASSAHVEVFFLGLV